MKEKGNYRSNKRLLQFDLIKVFACLLVIWGHTIMHMYVSDYSSQETALNEAEDAFTAYRKALLN